MAEYIIQKETLNGIADEVRNLSGISGEMSPSEMSENLGDANDEVSSQSSLLEQAIEALESKAVPSGDSFSNITVGNTTISASTAGDNVTLVAGDNVTITPDAPNKKITISASDTSARYIDGVSLNSNGDVTRYASCSTAAGTTAKSATITAGTLNLSTGARVTVKFTNANTASNPTLNVSSTGAKYIFWHGAYLPSSQYWESGAVLDFVYNGSQWELIGVAKDNSGSGGVTSLSDLGVTATATELNYVDGVTSNIQTQLNGKADSSHGTHVTFTTTTPKEAGTASVGTATTVSRSDHVHPAQTSVTGNAGTATTLTNTRYIDGVSFNGSANVTRYASCSTAAGTAAKTASISSGTFSLATGARVTVKFSNANTASSPTLNVGSTGAKTIRWRGATLPSTQYWAAAQVVDFVYDGTYWNMIGAANDNSGSGGSTSLSDLGVTATATELNYVDGVTSSIQTQLNTLSSESARHAVIMDTVRFNGLVLGPNGAPTDGSHHGGYVDFRYDSNTDDANENYHTSRIIEDNQGTIGLNFLTAALRWNGQSFTDIFSSKTLLWQNAAPLSSFSAQTIRLDLSEYQQLEIHTLLNGVTDSNGLGFSHLINIGTQYYYNMNGYYDMLERRPVRATSTGVEFGGSYRGETARDDRLIPYMIYGIKGVQ